MARLTVGVMVLTGITLSGGLGGSLMREGARGPRARVAAPQARPPVLLTEATAPCLANRAAADAGCDAVAPAGD